MKNIIGDVAALILLVFAVGIVGAIYLNSADSNVQTHLRDKTVAFVDSTRATGKINPSELFAFMETINGSGLFTVSVKVDRSITYADAATGDLKTDNIGISQSELLNYMFPDGADSREYILNTGDRISAKVTRTGAGLTGLMGLIGKSGQNGDLIYEYSGNVYHDGR